MMRVRNPHLKPEKALGLTAQEWTDIKAALTAHMQANDGVESFTPAALRALHPKLVDDEVWAHVGSVLNIEEV